MATQTLPPGAETAAMTEQEIERLEQADASHLATMHVPQEPLSLEARDVFVHYGDFMAIEGCSMPIVKLLLDAPLRQQSTLPLREHW